MPARGEVYWPKTALPPRSEKTHRVVILSSNTLIANVNHGSLLVAIIRTATSSVHRVFGHSVTIPNGTTPFLVAESIVETHQIFSLHRSEFDARGLKGRLAPDIMDQVMDGARKLLA